MKKLLKILIDIGMYVGIVVVLLWGVPAGLSKALHTPYPMASITSGSMWPALKTGDLILIQGVRKQDLKTGDVVVWQNERGFTIHRIVTLADDYVITKGDANFDPDKPVTYKDIIGRALVIHGMFARIPYVGLISMGVSNYVRHN